MKTEIFKCDKEGCGNSIEKEMKKGYPYNKGWTYIFNLELKVPEIRNNNFLENGKRIKIRDKHFCNEKHLIDFIKGVVSYEIINLRLAFEYPIISDSIQQIIQNYLNITTFLSLTSKITFKKSLNSICLVSLLNPSTSMLEPDGTSQFSNTTFPSFSAASNMPSDCLPRNFADFKLETTIIFFPISSAGLYHSLIPAIS